jgi:hypothetical protein
MTIQVHDNGNPECTTHRVIGTDGSTGAWLSGLPTFRVTWQDAQGVTVTTDIHAPSIEGAMVQFVQMHDDGSVRSITGIHAPTALLCWCGAAATYAQECDPEATTPTGYVINNGQPATAVCTEHAGASCWALDNGEVTVADPRAKWWEPVWAYRA